MRKLITMIFALFATALCAFTFVSCIEDVPQCEHAGGTATCNQKAICEKCGEEYGDFDSSNHAGTEFNYVSNGNGTHKKIYKCCEAVAADGEACSGGEATCEAKAICSSCKQPYGDKNAENHASKDVEYISKGNGKHDIVYACCKEVKTADVKCTGGEATVCGNRNVCEFCGAEYDEPLAHLWADEFESDGTQHWHKCTREGCTATSEKVKCSSENSVATCVDRAVCDTCNKPYGDIDSDNHDFENHAAKSATCEDIGWDEYRTCKRNCGYTEYKEFPALGHDYSKEWTTDETQHWHACSRCESKSELANHALASFVSGETEDTGLCSCGYETGDVFEKVVTAKRQDIILSLTDNTLSLSGVSEYDKVISITYDDLSFGTALNALVIPEGIGDKAHGEQNLIVTVEKDGFEHVITVPVTIVDAVLTAENLKENIQSNDATKVLNEGKYFILTDNIDASEIDWKASANWGTDEKDEEGNKIETGFKGSLDGRGFTVENLNIASGVPGIFNYTNNAVVKNINFTVANFVPQENLSVFGVITKVTIFENVTITFNCVFTATKGGILSGNNAVNNTYRNVTVMAEGSEIYYLVCGAIWGKDCSYTDVNVYADKVNYLYGTETAKDGITVKETVKIDLTENQDIVMTDETYSLDLGDELNGLTITSIVCDGENLGTDISNLDLTAFKTDYAKHGEKTIIVKGVKDDSRVRISVPVTLVTMMVTTVNDLRTITRTATDTEANAIFGYYKMANDINCNGSPDWAGFHNNAGFDIGKDTNGFRGTMDGNGKTITGKCHSHGLFRVIGKGAVIKNITFVSVQWTGSASGGLFGYAAFGATFDNVNVIMKSNDGSTPKDGALLFSSSCSGNTFNKLTVKVYSDDGQTLAENIPTVFGAWVYNNNYTDVKVYCKSYVKLATDGKNADVTEIENVTVYNTETEE